MNRIDNAFYHTPKKRGRNAQRMADLRDAKKQKKEHEDAESPDEQEEAPSEVSERSDSPESTEQRDTVELPDDHETPSTSKSVGTSRKKIAAFAEAQQTTESPSVTRKHSYVPMDVQCLQTMFSGVKCGQCGKGGLEVKTTERHGFCQKLVVECEICDETIAQTYTSERLISEDSTRPGFHVNQKMTEAFVGMGLGHTAKGEEPPSHTTRKVVLSPEVIKALRPIYERLSAEALLGKCVKGGTSNANEALHHLIWSNCPKEKFQSRKKLEVAVSLAVSSFNMGNVATAKLRHQLEGEELDMEVQKVAERRDKERERQSDKSAQKGAIYARKKDKQERSEKEKKKIQKEGVSYAPGRF